MFNLQRLHEELRLRETALREELQSKEAEISGLRKDLRKFRELQQQGGAGEVRISSLFVARITRSKGNQVSV